MSDLKAQVAARFAAVNGDHPMTPADDEYVSQYFVPLEELCASRSLSPDVIRQHMLAEHLPLPGYIRSDGTEMVPADLLELSEQAGGIELLGQWFTSHWTDAGKAAQEWRSYLNGHYVCLRTVTPATIQRKDYLVDAIGCAVADPRPQSRQWLEDLHRLVDELDELEPPFAPYDRLRFGRPISRDTAIDAVRAAFPHRQPEPTAPSEENVGQPTAAH